LTWRATIFASEVPLADIIRFNKVDMKAAPKAVKFYFDPISPYAWLAWNPVLSLCRKHNVELVPAPILFAGLLNHHGQLGPAEIPSKKIFIMKDVARRANARGLTVNPPPSHPFNPLLALRSMTVVINDKVVDSGVKFDFVSAILDACWVKGEDLSDKKTIISVADKLGLHGHEIVRSAQNDQQHKDTLKANTDNAIAEGVFGVPTCIIDGDLYWGSETDTIDQIGKAVVGDPVPVPPELLQRWVNIKASASRK
jgi:2-hydroxychromene-2-carboxylate isomerase